MRKIKGFFNYENPDYEEDMMWVSLDEIERMSSVGGHISILYFPEEDPVVIPKREAQAFLDALAEYREGK